MTPFFFGSGSRRLFGIYEAAAPGSAGRRAAVLCNPWGSEYIYAHRSLRQLALHLCRAGIHTLRFDYFGTGDSAGEMTDANLPGWEADIETAMEELQDITGVPRITLAGLRLGGSLAAQVALRRAPDLDRLVMWAPIIAGAAFVHDLIRDAPGPAREADHHAAAAETMVVQGFPLTLPMRAQMQTIKLEPFLAAPPLPSLLLVSGGGALPALSQSLETALIDGETPWTEGSSSTGAVAVSAVQQITDWLS